MGFGLRREAGEPSLAKRADRVKSQPSSKPAGFRRPSPGRRPPRVKGRLEAIMKNKRKSEELHSEMRSGLSFALLSRVSAEWVPGAPNALVFLRGDFSDSQTMHASGSRWSVLLRDAASWVNNSPGSFGAVVNLCRAWKPRDGMVLGLETHKDFTVWHAPVTEYAGSSSLVFWKEIARRDKRGERGFNYVFDPRLGGFKGWLHEPDDAGHEHFDKR